MIMKVKKLAKTNQQAHPDCLFKLPVPIPEPPRVINTRPSVPDLSITYRPEDSRENQIGNGYRFDYISDGKNGQCGGDGLNDKEQDIIAAINRINHRLTQQTERIRHEEERGFTVNRRHGNIAAEKCLNDGRVNRNNGRSNLSSEGIGNGRNVIDLNYDQRSLSQIVRMQEEKLERISEQIQRILKLHEKSVTKKESEKKSVETMTSFAVKENHLNKFSATRRRQERLTKRKQLDAACITSRTDDYSDSPGYPAGLKYRQDHEEKLYQRILRGIDERISRSRSEGTDSFSESSSPPRRIHENDNLFKMYNQNSPSPETIIINKLTDKYLRKEKVPTRNRPCLRASLSSDQDDIDLEPVIQKKRTPIKVYDFTEEASIGIQNYLAKYGLLNELCPKVALRKN